MGKLYLEVFDRRLLYLSANYIPLNIVEDLSEDMKFGQFKELSAEILRTVKKYAAANDIDLGCKYNNSTDDAAKCQYQKYSTRVFVENGKHFNNATIEYDSYTDTVKLNWADFSYYDPVYEEISFKKISD